MQNALQFSTLELKLGLLHTPICSYLITIYILLPCRVIGIHRRGGFVETKAVKAYTVASSFPTDNLFINYAIWVLMEVNVQN